MGLVTRVLRPEPIVPISDLTDDSDSGDGDGEVVLDLHQLEQQPDWSYDGTDSGKAPADRLADSDSDTAAGAD